MEPVMATVGDVTVLAPVVARALADDPMVRWRRPGSTFEQSSAHYRDVLHEYVGVEVLWRIGDAATAAWLSPHDGRRLRDARAERRAAVPSDHAGGDLTSAALWEWMDAHLPDEPVWFLDLVAVEPALQGSGLGGALVAHGLKRARAEGFPAFLQTSNEGNLTFYRSHGFRVADAGQAPPDGPTVWFLQCDPGGPS